MKYLRIGNKRIKLTDLILFSAKIMLYVNVIWWGFTGISLCRDWVSSWLAMSLLVVFIYSAYKAVIDLLNVKLRYYLCSGGCKKNGEGDFR